MIPNVDPNWPNEDPKNEWRKTTCAGRGPPIEHKFVSHRVRDKVENHSEMKCKKAMILHQPSQTAIFFPEISIFTVEKSSSNISSSCQPEEFRAGSSKRGKVEIKNKEFSGPS